MACVTDMTGLQFGAWAVLHKSERPANSRVFGAWWECRCTCGRTELISGAKLRAGRMKRGCLACAGRLHRKSGKGASPTYNTWRAMRGRCLRPDDTNYRRYGGRGITICDRWRESFPNFLADMGERPAGLTLDRIDTNGNYEPSNCRWANAKTQARNSDNFKLTDEQVLIIRRILGFGVPAILLADLLGVARSHIANISINNARQDAA